ncbi:MAG: hypothetical protein HYS27_06120 [Deltaproteobacteria bacterium]|nr:hypothetical protein [Deltaproteobacteria bacterium]
MKRSVVLLAALAAAACAENPRLVGAAPTVLWEHAPNEPRAPAAAPLSVEEARTIAAAHDAAHTCELTARALRGHDRARGWAVLQHCIERPDFTDLEALTSAPWLEDVAASPDAARLLAHVIAARGGDVHHDLRLVRRARIPVFSLQAAIADPESYQGRYLLLLGTPKAGHQHGGMRAVEIVETRIMAESEWVAAGPRTTTQTATSMRRDDGNHAVPLNEDYRRSEGPRVEVLHNVSVETGRGILVDVGDDPFLEVGTDYVLLLRFDGTRDAVNGSVLEERPVATVVAYFEPASGLFARLGR